jgi:hypothetical protein
MSNFECRVRQLNPTLDTRHLTFPDALFEQVIERLPGSGRARRTGLTLDGGPGRKELARVCHVLWRNSGGNGRLRTLPTCAGIERDALNAAVKVDAASAAPAERSDVEREAIATSGAPEHFVRGHQVGSSRTGLILKGPPAAWRTLLGRGFAAFGAFRSAIPLVVLIPPLLVLSITHFLSGGAALYARPY